ncbi:MAG: zinc ribbon domain-containing protein [Candidatus Dormibacteria bacterium]
MPDHATKVRGQWAYRAQLVMDGTAPVRHPVGSEQVSLDLGPSTAHVVSETNAFHASLAPGIIPVNQDLRRAQRKLDRQHRQGSPSCFDAQHRHQADGCDWKERSHSAQRTQVKVAEFQRVLAARCNTEHGQLANPLIRLGPNLRAEKLNYVAWQKSFPRSVRDRAPGSFVAKLRHQAESAGGRLYEYDPRTTALSQTYVCERKVKKPLSQRIHSCECGVVADRDLFSAFLGLYVKPREDIDTLDAGSGQHGLLHPPRPRWGAGVEERGWRREAASPPVPSLGAPLGGTDRQAPSRAIRNSCSAEVRTTPAYGKGRSSNGQLARQQGRDGNPPDLSVGKGQTLGRR